jgi:hypothetical protein
MKADNRKGDLDKILTFKPSGYRYVKPKNLPKPETKEDWQNVVEIVKPLIFLTPDDKRAEISEILKHLAIRHRLDATPAEVRHHLFYGFGAGYRLYLQTYIPYVVMEQIKFEAVGLAVKTSAKDYDENMNKIVDTLTAKYRAIYAKRSNQYYFRGSMSQLLYGAFGAAELCQNGSSPQPIGTQSTGKKSPKKKSTRKIKKSTKPKATGRKSP